MAGTKETLPCFKQEMLQTREALHFLFFGGAGGKVERSSGQLSASHLHPTSAGDPKFCSICVHLFWSSVPNLSKETKKETKKGTKRKPKRKPKVLVGFLKETERKPGGHVSGCKNGRGATHFLGFDRPRPF